MGTTLTTVRLDRDQLGLLHIGDSRAYLLRNGVLFQLSHDDTLAQSLVDEGLISRQEARFHPRRNVVLHALMGREPRFRLTNFEVQERDRLLLCSDGVTDVLPDDTLRDLLASFDLNGCAEAIVRRALRSGAIDNVTCIVADVTASPASGRPVFVGATITDD
jgi:PPM family protein phosphatase